MKKLKIGGIYQECRDKESNSNYFIVLDETENVYFCLEINTKYIYMSHEKILNKLVQMNEKDISDNIFSWIKYLCIQQVDGYLGQIEKSIVDSLCQKLYNDPIYQEEMENS